MDYLDQIMNNAGIGEGNDLPFDGGTTFDGSIASLEKFLEEEERNNAEFVEGQFGIQSADQADYILGRVKALQENIDEVKNLGKQKVERVKEMVDKWIEKSTAEDTRKLENYQQMLASFVSSQLEGSKKKSMNFTNGTVGFKSQQPEYQYEDNLIVESIKQLPIDTQEDLISKVVKESVDKTKLKKMIQLDEFGKPVIGETEVEGLTVTPRPDKFYVK